jgi:hypothetical protein
MILSPGDIILKRPAARPIFFLRDRLRTGTAVRVKERSSSENQEICDRIVLKTYAAGKNSFTVHSGAASTIA